MAEKWYKITFSAKLTEDDLETMQDVFFDVMNESMEIMELADLNIEADKNQEDLLVY